MPSWFHLLARLAACQRNAAYVGQDAVQAATQRSGRGGTPTFCVLLRLRQCWQVNLAVLEPRTERGRLHSSHPWLNQNIWNYPALAYVESPMSVLWYDLCWAISYKVCSKVVPYHDTVLLSALTAICVPESSAFQHKLVKADLVPQGSCGFDETALCTGKFLTSSV